MIAVLGKELRARMRGWGAPVTLTLYLVFLALTGAGFFNLVTSQQFGWGGSQLAMMGVWLFTLLSIFQVMLIVNIAPALTAPALCGEKERQTFDLLLSTRLTGFGIVTGKLIASMSYAVLLILASIPLFSLVFVFGGVPVMLVLKVFLMQFAAAAMLGTAGLFISAVAKRTQVAIAVAVALALFVTFGTFLVGMFMPAVGRSPDIRPAGPGMFVRVAPNRPPQPVIPPAYYVNPIIGLTSAMAAPGIPIGLPFLPIPTFPAEVMMKQAMARGGAAPAAAEPRPMPLWKAQLYIYSGAAAAFYLATVAIVDPRPRRRFPWPRRRPARLPDAAGEAAGAPPASTSTGAVARPATGGGVAASGDGGSAASEGAP